MAKGLTKTAVKARLKRMTIITKQLMDDKMTNPRSHVVMSANKLLDLNKEFMGKLKSISK
jgi:hypothetical protein|tara:strand:- start:808 stop:987 length:180 start_codon:yes stop_codon:yes gene_type:complete